MGKPWIFSGLSGDGNEQAVSCNHGLLGRDGLRAVRLRRRWWRRDESHPGAAKRLHTCTDANPNSRTDPNSDAHSNSNSDTNTNTADTYTDWDVQQLEASLIETFAAEDEAAE